MSERRTARMEIRTTPERRAAVEARAQELGQSLTTFVERALDKALGETGSAGPSAAAGTSAPSRAPEPVQVPGPPQELKDMLGREEPRRW